MSKKLKTILASVAVGVVVIKLSRDGLFGETIGDFVSNVTNYSIIEGVKF